ncbi:MAG: sigma-70 family RNA polymerase sigma factor [Candidatus Hydrogenedentes bacterium]|nr:sigma-70 family RNA polymerase sigma factor [Candidatus Hydrogenedentota bacterium]
MRKNEQALKTDTNVTPLLRSLPEHGTTLPPREMEDDALLFAYKEGSESAFEELVRRYQQKIFLYIYRMLQNKHIAEELTQEVFLALVKNINRYNPQGKFAAYLFAIASNKVHKEWEQRKRRPKFFSLSFWSNNPNAAHDGASPLDTIPDTKACVEKSFKRKEVSDAVHEALKHLPERYREAFVLRRFLDLSYNEIADITDCPIGTAKSRVVRAERKLRPYLLHFREYLH